jgi:LysR family cyn operon transcriptional activator
MELRHIRYFVRAAELRHFTHAAESLYVSQPTLSTHIHQLEEELGLPLFDRLGRIVQLTEAGQVFLEHAVQALRELERATEEIADLKGIISGALSICALPGYGHKVLPALISSFHAKYPQINFEIKSGTSDFLEEQVLSGAVVLGLSFVPPTKPNIDYRVLFSNRRNFVVSEKHALANRKEISLEEIAEQPLALISPRYRSRLGIDETFANKGMAPKILVEMDDLHAMLEVVADGDLGTVLTGFGVGGFPGLHLIPIEHIPIVHFGVLWQAGSYLNPAAKAFVQHVVSEQAMIAKLGAHEDC